MHSEKKYFKHLEPEALTLEDIPEKFAQVLVIPLYGEGKKFLNTLQSIPQDSGKTIVVLVLNAAEDSPVWVHEANQELRNTLSSFKFSSGKILLIDRAQPSSYFPRKKGVGLARKIGADIAWRLIQEKKIENPWIHCTDADALLPSDYFERSRKETNSQTAALLYPFQHFSKDPELAQAGLLYEKFLEYYVEGLSFAGSPYAFQTLGSTLAVSAHHYAQALGFPDLQAGEDFYLLNKLAKLGEIKTLSGPPLKLEARLSTRVPFGTGAALGKIQGLAQREDYLFYHPQIFVCLRAWLQTLKDYAENPSANLEEKLSLPLLLEALQKNKLLVGISKLPTQKNPAQRLKNLHTWFDAFKTLKLVHSLREKLPSLPWKEAMAESPWHSSPTRNNS